MNKIQTTVLLMMVLVFLFSLSVFVIIFSQASFIESKEEIELESIPCEEIMENTIITKTPAVDKNGDGILLDLEVGIMPGSGKVLTDIENLLFWVDTQQSIKTANMVAERVSGIDTSNMNIAYTLKASGNSTAAVGGGSAGAILTLSTIAALKNKPMNYSIAITGSISENGTIGNVAGIKNKIKAAIEGGATLFLVPKGQGIMEAIKPIKKCNVLESIEICEIFYKKTEINTLEEELNITVKEVSNITEAMEYYNL